jgi:hypothetical protein
MYCVFLMHDCLCMKEWSDKVFLIYGCLRKYVTISRFRSKGKSEYCTVLNVGTKNCNKTGCLHSAIMVLRFNCRSIQETVLPYTAILHFCGSIRVCSTETLPLFLSTSRTNPPYVDINLHSQNVSITNRGLRIVDVNLSQFFFH